MWEFKSCKVDLNDFRTFSPELLDYHKRLCLSTRRHRLPYATEKLGQKAHTSTGSSVSRGGGVSGMGLLDVPEHFLVAGLCHSALSPMVWPDSKCNAFERVWESVPSLPLFWTGWTG